MADDLTESQKAEYKVAFDKYAEGGNLRAKKLSVVRAFLSLCPKWIFLSKSWFGFRFLPDVI